MSVEAAATVVTAPHTESLFEFIVRFFIEGGPFMYVTLLVFLLGIAISLERFIYLNLVQSRNQGMWKILFPLMTQGKFKTALDEAKQSNSAIARILVYGLTRSTFATKHEEIEMAMEEGLMETIPSLERRTHYVATFANIATLLGLLGTVTGLVTAFHQIELNAGQVTPADLAKGIWEALITTVFGLIIAIPCMAVYHFLDNRAGAVTLQIQWTVAYLDEWTNTGPSHVVIEHHSPDKVREHDVEIRMPAN